MFMKNKRVKEVTLGNYLFIRSKYSRVNLRIVVTSLTNHLSDTES
jgi:hypothetical protein